MALKYKCFKNLNEIVYPWIIISRNDTRRIRNFENEPKSNDAFFELWFSGINGREDFFHSPVSYYIEKRAGGFTVVEDAPLLSYNGYEVPSLDIAKKRALNEAEKWAKSTKSLVFEKNKLKLNLYYHNGNLKFGELAKIIYSI
jgi:hypothetical protein